MARASVGRTEDENEDEDEDEKEAMAFTKEQLLLPEVKMGQLEKGLATLGVDDPLQFLCDEAASDVARLTAGYVLDETAQRGFIRGLAVYRAYTFANVPPPVAVKDAYEKCEKELEAIAEGKRPNLAKVVNAGLAPIAGTGASQVRVPGRMEG